MSSLCWSPIVLLLNNKTIGDRHSELVSFHWTDHLIGFLPFYCLLAQTSQSHAKHLLSLLYIHLNITKTKQKIPENIAFYEVARFATNFLVRTTLHIMAQALRQQTTQTSNSTGPWCSNTGTLRYYYRGEQIASHLSHLE